MKKLITMIILLAISTTYSKEIFANNSIYEDSDKTLSTLFEVYLQIGGGTIKGDLSKIPGINTSKVNSTYSGIGFTYYHINYLGLTASLDTATINGDSEYLRYDNSETATQHNIIYSMLKFKIGPKYRCSFSIFELQSFSLILSTGVVKSQIYYQSSFAVENNFTREKSNQNGIYFLGGLDYTFFSHILLGFEIEINQVWGDFQSNNQSLNGTTTGFNLKIGTTL